MIRPWPIGHLILNSRMINAKYPPTPMVAAKGDGATDDSPLFDAARTNGYHVFVPEGVYVTSKTLVSDYRSRIEGASVFKTRFVPTDSFPSGQPVIHMQSGDSRFDRLGGHFSVGTAVGDYTVGKYNADGVLLTGCLYSIDHIHVSGTNRAYVLDTTNTYLVTLEHCSAAYNNEVLVAPAPVSNANENISFINCMFYNNVDGISNNGFELLFTNCSIDYCSGSMLKFNDGQMSFVNCHFEWGTTAPLLNPYGGATSLKYGAVIFTNCGFFKANSGWSWDRITKSILLSSLFTSGSIYVNHCWSQDTNGNVYTVDENLLIDAPTGTPTLSTTYQNTKGVPLHMYLQVVMNPTSSVNASFTPFVWEAGADMESLVEPSPSFTLVS
jgi:hypothetical protein